MIAQQNKTPHGSSAPALLSPHTILDDPPITSNSNKNKNNPSTYSSKTTEQNYIHRFKFGSYNIRGNFKNKYHHILSIIANNKIDACFICETNTKPVIKNTEKYSFHKTNIRHDPTNTTYFVIHSADNNQNSGSGVAFIVHQ